MDMIAKKYRVLKTLGQGAMGEVFLVLPPRGDPVALKLLKNVDTKGNASAVQQFENEFKVLKKLAHPNIGRIYDYGYDEDVQKVFFTLPWLRGTDIFVATQNLDFEKCEAWFVEILRALNYLHQKNLIHCDLKPGNVFIEDGHALLIDFGLAGYWGESIVGTPTYLAPEVFRGARHSILSDLYAAGVIFYNCLSRSQPFSGKTLQEVYDRHRGFTPPPISDINPKVPKYFSDIVATLLNKKPEERFPNAVAVIQEIDAFSKNRYPVETNETLLSYLPTQADLIGRKDEIWNAEMAVSDFLATEKVAEPYHLLLIRGQRSVGKSKIIAKAKNDLQLAKISVEAMVPPLQENDRHVLMESKAMVFEDIDTYSAATTERKNLTDAYALLEQKVLSPKTTRLLLIASTANAKDVDELKKIFPAEHTKITELEIVPFTRDETGELLQNILGHKDIPAAFVDQFHRNTEGLPGLATQLIQSMIEKGLLFDKSGRWNEDLMSELEHAFEHLEISESLEQQFEKTYAQLSDAEADLVNWLCICPYALSLAVLEKLAPRPDLKQLLDGMVERRVIREEKGLYAPYRGVFQAFIQENLPDNDLRRRHARLAQPDLGLSNKWRVYHLSLGTDPTLALRAKIKLAQIYEKEGDHEKAYEIYIKLTEVYKTNPLEEKIGWFLSAASLLIWMNRFQEAIDLLSKIESDLQKHKTNIDPDLMLTLLEKKGMSLKHLEKLDNALLYFEKGLNLAEKNSNHKVHQLRFQNNLAEIELLLGHHKEAVSLYEKTRELSLDLTPEELQKITNNDLGHVYVQQQQYDKALPYLREDIRIFSGMKNREPLVRALYSYALTLRAQNKIDKAIQSFDECIKICKIGSYYPMLLRSYNALGNLYLAMKDGAQALKTYQKALEIAVRLQETTSKAALLVNQGMIYKNEKNWALATRRFMMAKQVLENKATRLSFDEMLLSKCYSDLALIAMEEKNTMKALSYQLERMKIVEDSNTMRPEKFVVKLDLAELYMHNRLKEQFLATLKELTEMAESPEEKEKVRILRDKWESVSESSVKHDATAEIAFNPSA